MVRTSSSGWAGPAPRAPRAGRAGRGRRRRGSRRSRRWPAGAAFLAAPSPPCGMLIERDAVAERPQRAGDVVVGLVVADDRPRAAQASVTAPTRPPRRSGRRRSRRRSRPRRRGLSRPVLLRPDRTDGLERPGEPAPPCRPQAARAGAGCRLEAHGRPPGERGLGQPPADRALQPQLGRRARPARRPGLHRTVSRAQRGRHPRRRAGDPGPPVHGALRRRPRDDSARPRRGRYESGGHDRRRPGRPARSRRRAWTASS